VITFIKVGSCAITASQAAGPTYTAPTPVTNTFQITPLTPTSVITPPTTTPACGASAALTDTVTGTVNVTLAGTVQFFDNGVAIGAPVTVGAGGVATLNTTGLTCGANTITSTFTPATGSPYNPVNASPVSYPVGADALTFPTLPNIPFGSTPPVPAATATNTATPVTYSTTSTACSVTTAGVITVNTVGSCAITASQAAGPTYTAPTPITNTFQITALTPTSVVGVPPTAPSCTTSVTLTDTVTGTAGVTLAGTVQFYDTVNGVTTAIGPAVPVGVGGVATLTTTALNCGPNSITAVFTPVTGSPYVPSTGGPTPLAVNALDFTIAATPPLQIVNPGDTTSYTVSLSGLNGVAFTSAVTLTATGLPPGATVTFANPSYVPGVGPTSTTMTIVTSPTQAMLRRGNGITGIYYGLLLLPLLGLGAVRRRLRALPKGLTYCLAALLLLGGLGAVTGCGGGYIGPPPNFFPITVTGTSGALHHSATVVLEVR